MAADAAAGVVDPDVDMSERLDRAFVKVPRALEVIKTKGEPATIALRKRPDGSIEVTALE